MGYIREMKKLLSILVLSLLLSGSAYASKIGKGQIQLSDEVTESFIKFLRNEYGAFFVVNPDGIVTGKQQTQN